MPSYLSHHADGGSRDCGAFFLDVIGQYKDQEMEVRWSDQPRPSNPEVDRVIEETWQGELQRAGETGRKLFNGNLCRLIECQVQDTRLVLTLGQVTFKEFLGTNLTHAHLRYVHGVEVLSDALGVSAAVATKDGFILMGRRSQRVVYHAGRLHPIGGVVEPADAPSHCPNPFKTIVRELTEETNLPASSVLECICLGIVRDKHIVQPELIFDMSVDAEVETIRRSAEKAVDRDEHTELVTVRNHPAAVVTFMEQHFGELTPLGLATLLLHGLRHWGSGWFAAARGYLRSVI